MKNYCFLLLSLLMFSCSQKKVRSTAFQNKPGLDLEKIDFNENPLEILKSKIDSSANSQEEFAKKGYSAPFDYPVGYKFDPWNGKDSFYGKAYYSKVTDSIAYYKNIDFNRIAFLTHKNKTVAVLGNAEMKSDTVYNDLIKQLTKQYGTPSLRPSTTMDVFYEWTTKDRYIQIDYSKGMSISAMSGKATEMKETFNLEMLIFNKDAAKAIQEIQQSNYAKTKNYKIMDGDFKLYKGDPSKNIILADSLLNEKFKK